MQKTKIVATLGPSSDSVKIIKELLEAGMDAVRINLSHNTLEYHKKVINNVRKSADDLKLPIPVILDLQGPKIRIGKIPAEGIEVYKGEKLILIPENSKAPIKTGILYVPIQFANLYKYVKAGMNLLIDDAAIELKILNISGKLIECEVENDGLILSYKGINVPGAKIKTKTITEKDLSDLEFGIKNKVDYVALSYIGSPKDMVDLKNEIFKLEQKYNKNTIKANYRYNCAAHTRTMAIAKIERPEAVKQFDKILEVSDAIMIARGDLGMEMPLEELPLIQKDIIKKCLKNFKPVIVATQMLNSMIANPYPTRAEVSDVANAILDGADAIMLSGETATGKYPLKSVKTMDKIAKEVEPAEIGILKYEINTARFSPTEAIAQTAKILAEENNAKAIITTTHSGFTARTISSLKPKQVVVALTPSNTTKRQVNLSWGVVPFLFKKVEVFDKMILDLKKIIIKEKIARPGDLVIICTGHPMTYKGETNLIKIEKL
jgi:pyruvate kinase